MLSLSIVLFFLILDIILLSVCNVSFVSLNYWAAFKFVVASLEARGAFKIVACFLHHGNSKVCLQVHFCFI